MGLIKYSLAVLSLCLAIFLNVISDRLFIMPTIAAIDPTILAIVRCGYAVLLFLASMAIMQILSIFKRSPPPSSLLDKFQTNSRTIQFLRNFIALGGIFLYTKGINAGADLNIPLYILSFSPFIAGWFTVILCIIFTKDYSLIAIAQFIYGFISFIVFFAGLGKYVPIFVPWILLAYLCAATADLLSWYILSFDPNDSNKNSVWLYNMFPINGNDSSTTVVLYGMVSAIILMGVAIISILTTGINSFSTDISSAYNNRWLIFTAFATNVFGMIFGIIALSLTCASSIQSFKILQVFAAGIIANIERFPQIGWEIFQFNPYIWVGIYLMACASLITYLIKVNIVTTWGQTIRFIFVSLLCLGFQVGSN